uniref:Uncharacterized protein n=1 Tax=Physcomitrium patens TaxID=3218 RepID=A0A7I4E1T2_PHYPA
MLKCECKILIGSIFHTFRTQSLIPKFPCPESLSVADSRSPFLSNFAPGFVANRWGWCFQGAGRNSVAKPAWWQTAAGLAQAREASRGTFLQSPVSPAHCIIDAATADVISGVV